MYLLQEYNFLINKGLWIVVDPWINQPFTDQKYYAELGIDINVYNHIFLDKLNHELQDISKHKPNKKVKNIIIYQEADTEIHPLFNKPKYPVFKNIDDLHSYSKSFNHIVLCGLHYGMCVHSCLKRLSKVYPQCNYYVKRDLCCPMPLHSLYQYDCDVKEEGAKLI